MSWTKRKPRLQIKISKYARKKLFDERCAVKLYVNIPLLEWYRLKRFPYVE